jgi:YHS domain-containing protein
MSSRVLSRVVIGAIGAVLATGAVAAAAGQAANRTRGGVGIHGYDPVAYFTESRPVEGSASFEHEFDGTRYRFVSEANRAAFAGAPERYVPQYGGFCAWAVSRGYTADIDPNAWRIVDGKLYLNYSTRVQRTWEQDVEGNISRADAHWPKLRAR